MIENNITCSNWFGRSFRVDQANGILFVNISDKSIRIVKDFKKAQERVLDIQSINGAYIKDFSYLDNQRLLVVTDDGHLSLFEYQIAQNELKIDPESELKDVYCIGFNPEYEVTNAMAVCPKSRYAFISTRNVSGSYQKAIYVVKILENQIGEKSESEPKSGKSKGKGGKGRLKEGQFLVHLHTLPFEVNLGFFNFRALCIPFYVEEKPVLIALQNFGDSCLYSYMFRDGKLVEFFSPIEQFSNNENLDFCLRKNCVININKGAQLQILKWKRVG